MQNFNPLNNDWITSIEASELTGYHPDVFRKARNNGIINAIKRGRQFFYLRTDVVEYTRKMKEMGSTKHTPRIYRQ